MTPLEQEIVELSKRWQYFVGQDHHKDRDCHWYVTQYYSYGEEPYFKASHHGYVGNDFEGTKCKTIEEAQEELRDNLLVQIHNSKIWVTRNLDDVKQIIAENKEDMFLGSIEEYERMLAALNGDFSYFSGYKEYAS